MPPVSAPAPADAARAAAVAALEGVVARHPGGRTREGQAAMAAAVAEALATGRHLLVEAGTGTGKSLAYLVPAVLHAVADPPDPPAPEDVDDLDEDVDAPPRRVVVVTATKALQEQLVGKDLPFVRDALRAQGVRFRFAMLKGRSNYLCVAKVSAALATPDELAGTSGFGGRSTAEGVRDLAWWAWATPSGDRADHPRAIPDHVWGEASVDAQECPGATRCAFGDVCFAEAARRRAMGADVVVVNGHLYALHLESGGGLLPPHGAVVFDEAHAMEDIAASAFGATIGPGRLRALAGRLRRVLADAALPGRLDELAADLRLALDPLAGRRVQPGQAPLAPLLARVRDAAEEIRPVLAGLRPVGDDATGRIAQALRLVDALRAHLEVALRLGAGDDEDPGGGPGGGPRGAPVAPAQLVAWVEGGGRAGPMLRVAPVDVGPLLAGRLRDGQTLIATSATLAVGGDLAPAAWRLGLRDPSEWDGLVVASPFDYGRQGLLYCATSAPSPKEPAFAAAVAEELVALIGAAGGRSLALFTSRAAMRAAADAVAPRLPDVDVLVQDDLPRPELLRRLRTEPTTAVFATQGFWQGVDVPGSALLLVTIDRLPFPRPDDPLLQARRDAAAAGGANPFSTVDIPRAGTLLAQGVGRLIRSDTDVGVVAVLDKRLTFASYAWTLVRSLPPLRRTRDRGEVEAFLRNAAAEAAAAEARAATERTAARAAVRARSSADASSEAASRGGWGWSDEEDRALAEAYLAGARPTDLATAASRTLAAVRTRLRVLGLEADGPNRSFACSRCRLRRPAAERADEWPLACTSCAS